jgi:hypothetical protein
MKHDDGHTIQIKHAALSPSNRLALSKMKVQNFYDGGISKSNLDENGFPIYINSEDPTQVKQEGPIVNTLKEFPQGTPEAESMQNSELSRKSEFENTLSSKYKQLKESGAGDVNTEAVLNNQSPEQVMANRAPTSVESTQGMAPTAIAPQKANPAQADNDPYGMGKYNTDMTSAVKEQRQGIIGEANAQSQLSKAQSQILSDQQKDLAAQQAAYQDANKIITDKRQAAMNAYQEQKIDPNRFFTKQDTMGKMGIAIGMILGGFGAAATGHNYGAEMLDKLVDNDIKAQQSELGKKENLVQMYMHEGHEAREAAQMAKLNILDLTKLQIEKAQVNANDPLAQSRKLQLLSAVDQHAAQIQQQMTMQKAMLTNAQNNPGMAIRALVPEHQQAEAYKELGERQKQDKTIENVKNSMQQIAKLQSTSSRVGSPLQSSSKIDAMKTEILSLAHDAFGKTSDNEIQIIEKNIPKYTDNEATVKSKIHTVENLLKQKQTSPILDTYNLAPRQNNNQNREIPRTPKK